ncbi:hypothetical protein D3C71_1817440 [compost metagenome]
MLLVERLGDIKCFFGGKSVLAIGFALQQCQIVQLVRIFLGFFNLIRSNPRRLALDLGCKSLRFGAVR